MILYDQCPMAQTLAILNGKWKHTIFKELISGPKRYGELTRLVGSISQKVLREQLKQMEEDGIILRTVIKEDAPQIVEYSLTDLGVNLIPLLSVIRMWGMKNLKSKDGTAASCGDCNNCPPTGC